MQAIDMLSSKKKPMTELKLAEVNEAIQGMEPEDSMRIASVYNELKHIVSENGSHGKIAITKLGLELSIIAQKEKR